MAQPHVFLLDYIWKMAVLFLSALLHFHLSMLQSQSTNEKMPTVFPDTPKAGQDKPNIQTTADFCLTLDLFFISDSNLVSFMN